MDAVVKDINTERQAEYKNVVNEQVLTFMNEEKAVFVDRASKVLLQPLSLGQKFEGKGVANLAEAGKLAGVDPASDFNTLDIQSKLDKLDNFDSVFGEEIPRAKNAEEEAIAQMRLIHASPKLIMTE
jgi:hypothetical protein